MSAAWITVLATGVGTVVLKAVGPVGVAGRELPPRVASLRIVGVAAGAVAVLLRAPLWAVVVAGAVATAVARMVS
jgi:hypothetical protein